METNFPTIDLTQPMVIQPEISVSSIRIIEILDLVQENELYVLVRFDENDQREGRVMIFNPSNYISDWTDEMIIDGVKKHYGLI